MKNKPDWADAIASKFSQCSTHQRNVIAKDIRKAKADGMREAAGLIDCVYPASPRSIRAFAQAIENKSGTS